MLAVVSEINRAGAGDGRQVHGVVQSKAFELQSPDVDRQGKHREQHRHQKDRVKDALRAVGLVIPTLRQWFTSPRPM